MCKFHVIDKISNDGFIYEFQCARQLDDNTFLIVKNFDNAPAAEEYAKGYDCVILHNVRVAGKVKKVSK